MSRTRNTDELAQVCWCDTHMRYVPPAVVWAGEGWSCGAGCEPGCEAGAGVQHGPKRGRPRKAAA